MDQAVPLVAPALAGDALSAASLAGRHAAYWRPGLLPACHSEIFTPAIEAGGTAMALALALDGMRVTGLGEEDRRAVLWVQDREALRLAGRPYRPGLPETLRARLIHVAAQRPEDALFALEEGLRCRDLACVIGEIAGNPRALTFTASRRLTLTAEKHGVPLYLVRLDAERDLGSARMRWQVSSAPSPQPRWDARAPGMPSWRAELFRARTHPQGEWTLRDDGTCLVAARTTATPAPDHGGLAGQAGDRPLAAS